MILPILSTGWKTWKREFWKPDDTHLSWLDSQLWLAGYNCDWLATTLIDWLQLWLAGYNSDWLAVTLIGWLYNSDWLAVTLIGWLYSSDWLAVTLIGWLYNSDWLAVTLGLYNSDWLATTLHKQSTRPWLANTVLFIQQIVPLQAELAKMCFLGTF